MGWHNKAGWGMCVAEQNFVAIGGTVAEMLRFNGFQNGASSRSSKTAFCPSMSAMKYDQSLCNRRSIEATATLSRCRWQDSAVHRRSISSAVFRLYYRHELWWLDVSQCSRWIYGWDSSSLSLSLSAHPRSKRTTSAEIRETFFERPQRSYTYLFMVALWNRADHCIFMLWFVLSSSSSFFPRLISAAADWMSAILPHMVWP